MFLGLYEGDESLSAYVINIDEFHADTGIVVLDIADIYMDNLSLEMYGIGKTGDVKEQVYNVVNLMRTLCLNKHAALAHVLRIFDNEVIIRLIGHLERNRTAFVCPLLGCRKVYVPNLIDRNKGTA